MAPGQEPLRWRSGRDLYRVQNLPTRSGGWLPPSEPQTERETGQQTRKLSNNMHFIKDGCSWTDF